MIVNMNGFRKQASAHINYLGRFILDNQEALKDAIDIEELVENYECVAQTIDMHNCIYDPKKENYSDLSDCLKVIRLEVDEDGDVVELN